MTTGNSTAPKRTRKGCGTRGRTGCPTCRARHVKCDEGRPACLKCTSTGRKCDGYENVKTPSNHQISLATVELAWFCNAKTTPWNDSQVTLATTLGLPSNEESSRFFHSFLHGCVPSLAEAWDFEFWKRDILRVSYSPAVQHASIALGAVYELWLARADDYGSLASSPQRQRLELLSSLRYTTAIQVLRRRILEPLKTLERLKQIMAACLLFIFMEILRGEDIAAVTHLDGAIKLFSYLQTTRKALDHPGDDSVLSNMDNAFEGLTKTFLRLDVQSVLYMGSRTPWYPDGTSVCFQTVSENPANFDTFLDARDNLYAHVANVMNFVTPPYGADICFPGFCPHPARGFDIYTIFHGSTYRDFHMPNASTQRRHYTKVLSRWKSAFQDFLQKDKVKTPETSAGCALLWLTYYTTRIKLAIAYTEDEYCYDEQLPSFKKIVEQAEAYQKYSATSLSPSPPAECNTSSTMPRLKPKKKSFNLHSCIGYPLYYTALKCRYEPVRQHALTMLRNADTDGIWDAQMLTKIAEYVIAIEDFEIKPEDGPHFGISEAHRIHCLSLNIDKASKIVWLQYSRKAFTEQGDISRLSNPLKRWRIDSTILTWDTTSTDIGDSINQPLYSSMSTPSSATPSENQTLPYRPPQSQC